MSPPLSTRGRNANRQCFERNAWCTRAQLYYSVSHTSIGIDWEAIMQTVCTKYPTSWVGSVVYRNFNISACASFSKYYKKIKYTPAVGSNILSKLIFASCVWYSDRSYYGLCVIIKDIGRRLPLQPQCSYQGQQGDVRQSVRENYETRFWGGQNLTAVELNASVYQVTTASRITGEGRAEILRTWGLDSDQKGGGGGVGGGGDGWGRSNYFCLKCTISRPWFLPCRCWALRSPILRLKYILQIQQAGWACDVTTIWRMGDFTSSGICYCVW